MPGRSWRNFRLDENFPFRTGRFEFGQAIRHPPSSSSKPKLENLDPIQLPDDLFQQEAIIIYRFRSLIPELDLRIGLPGLTKISHPRFHANDEGDTEQDR